MKRFLTISSFAALVAACGARTDLEPIRDIEGGGGAALTTVASTSVASSTSTEATTSASSSSAGGGPVCTTLGPPLDAPIALTDPSGDAMLTSLLSEGDRAFAASANNNDPSPDPSWRVREVAADLETLGPSQIVAKHPQGVSFSGMSLASQGNHRGALFWDESHGCRFVPILEDGAGGTAAEVDPTAFCYGLSATESGFYAFKSPTFGFMPLTLLSLDASGKVSSEVAVLPPSLVLTFPRGHARLDDGTLLLAHSESSGAYFGTRISLAGEVISKPHPIVTLGEHPEFAITSAGDHALAVWSSDHAPGDVLVANLDPDGTPNKVTFVGHAKPPTADVAILRYGDGALVAWSDASSDSIYVVRVSATGDLLTSAIEIAAPGLAHDLRLVPTTYGAMVGFAALAPGGLTQVWVSALPCSVAER
ncbi:MAG: hypothetical protein U0414_08460 [Polyangiaceae bacterium]